MSYCRKSASSDVYVHASAEDIVCYECPLIQKRSYRAEDVAEMLVHLDEHIDAGHKVNRQAIARLQNELRNQVLRYP